MNDFRLNPGSTYRVTSLGTKDEPIVTEGRFTGITNIGSMDALVLEVKAARKTSVRLVPTHAILALDVIEQVGAPVQKEGEPPHYV